MERTCNQPTIALVSITQSTASEGNSHVRVELLYCTPLRPGKAHCIGARHFGPNPDLHLVIVLKTAFAIILAACLLTPCRAAEPTAPTTTPKKPAVGKTTAAKRAAAAKPTASPKPVRPKNALRTEAELSGFTSETSDAFHGRLNLTKATAAQKWWVRTDYGYSTSRNFGKTKITESTVSGYNLDAAYRRNSKNAYSVLALIAGSKKRAPHASTYYDSAGFRMVSAGYGRAVLPGVELEAAVAHITREKDTEDTRITPLYTARLKKPINPSVTVDADVHLVQPFSENSLVDSRMNLTYRFTPTLSMRLTYVANNLLGTTLTKREWDKVFRVSLVFAR